MIQGAFGPLTEAWPRWAGPFGKVGSARDYLGERLGVHDDLVGSKSEGRDRVSSCVGFHVGKRWGLIVKFTQSGCPAQPRQTAHDPQFPSSNRSEVRPRSHGKFLFP